MTKASKVHEIVKSNFPSKQSLRRKEKSSWCKAFRVLPKMTFWLYDDLNREQGRDSQNFFNQIRGIFLLQLNNFLNPISLKVDNVC